MACRSLRRFPSDRGDHMATTEAPMKATKLIRGLRDRWRSKLHQRRQGDRDMAEIVRRGDHPMTEWDPFRMMRELLRWEPFRSAALMTPFERDAWMPHFEV